MSLLKSFVGALLAVSTCAVLAAVDANQADTVGLQSLKGIGPAMSDKIIEARKTGPFKDWDDLQSRVKGVGPGNATKLSAEGLTVDGAAFGEAAPPVPVAKKTVAVAKPQTPPPASAKK